MHEYVPILPISQHSGDVFEGLLFLKRWLRGESNRPDSKAIQHKGASASCTMSVKASDEELSQKQGEVAFSMRI